MAFSSGTFTIDTAGNPVVTGTTISSTVQNNTMTEIATGLTLCLLKDGTQTATASIPFAAGMTSTTGTFSGILSVDDTTQSTSTVTGSIHTDGGLGVVKDVFIGGVTTVGGNIVSDTDSTDDLGTTGVRWANLYVDDITSTNALSVANGGTGVQSTTAYAVVCGGTTGTAALQSIASVGTSSQVLTSNGAGALPTFQDAATITLGTEQSPTTSTTVTFGSIPSGTKKITFQFISLGSNGTSNWLVQLGDSGGLEASGYLGSSAQDATPSAFTAGFGIPQADAATIMQGTIVLTLEDSTNFTWVASGGLSRSDTTVMYHVAGSKSLSAELTQVALTTVNGTDQFNTGSLNIQYE